MSPGETEIMDVPLEGGARDMGHAGPQNQDHVENPNAEPEQSPVTEDHTESPAEEAPGSDRACLESSDHSLTDDVSANENYHLIPQLASTPNHTLRAGAATVESPVSRLHNGHTTPPSGLTNGSLPICTPPAASAGHPGWLLLPPPSPKGNGKAPPGKKRPPSCSTNSQHSLKTTAVQIQQVAGDDCCVHCVLACLFCELLSLCSALAQCLTCGRGCEALCCCGGGGVACGEEACSAGLDCGILEDCCESSDCLEICLECCSICFPT